MKLTRLALVAFLVFVPLTAFAQTPPVPAVGSTNRAYVLAPPATQNTVQTTGSVTSDTTISVGTLAGQVLTWLVAAFGVPIGGLLTAWLYRLFNLAGIQAADGLRTKLQEIIVNGLNAGAKNVAEQSEGKGQVEIKNAVVAQAVTYAQAHAADTLKQLGLDPQSGAAVEAIKARIETAINDPASPTPPVLDAPGVAAKAA